MYCLKGHYVRLTTTIAQSFQQALINRLNPQAASLDNPSIQPALQANRLAEQRGLELQQNALAEQAARSGTSMSGGNDALTRGDLVALQGDRPRTGGRTVTTQLFGQPFALPAGPATLARVAGVPLVPVFNFREGFLRTRLVVRPSIVVTAAGRSDEEVTRATHQLAREIEWAIRERPHQWFCFRNLWPS